MQRSAHPLPGTLGAFLPALVHPPLLPKPIRDRAEPYRARHAAHRRLGDRRLPRRDDRHAAHLGPFDPRIHLFAEDMDLCLRARAHGIRTYLHPDLAAHPHRAATASTHEPFAQLARNRRDVIERTRGTARAAARRRRPEPHVRHPRARQAAANERETAQLDAVLERRDPG